MSLSVDYISRKGQIAGVYEAGRGVWEFYRVEFGVPANRWKKIDGPYAEWRSELVNMAEKLEADENTRHGF